MCVLSACTCACVCRYGDKKRDLMRPSCSVEGGTEFALRIYRKCGGAANSDKVQPLCYFSLSCGCLIYCKFISTFLSAPFFGFLDKGLCIK